MNYLSLKNTEFKLFALEKLKLDNNDEYFNFKNFDYISIKYKLLSYSSHKKLKYFNMHITTEIFNGNNEYIELFKDNNQYKIENSRYYKSYINNIVLKILSSAYLNIYEFFISKYLFKKISTLNILTLDIFLIGKYICIDVLKMVFNKICINFKNFSKLITSIVFFDRKDCLAIVCLLVNNLFVNSSNTAIQQHLYINFIIELLKKTNTNIQMFKIVCRKIDNKYSLFKDYIYISHISNIDVKCLFYLLKNYNIILNNYTMMYYLTNSDKYSKVVYLLINKYKENMDYIMKNMAPSYNNFYILYNNKFFNNYDKISLIVNTAHNVKLFKWVLKKLNLTFNIDWLPHLINHNTDVIEYLYLNKMVDIQIIYKYYIIKYKYYPLHYFYNKYQIPFDTNLINEFGHSHITQMLELINL